MVPAQLLLLLACSYTGGSIWRGFIHITGQSRCTLSGFCWIQECFKELHNGKGDCWTLLVLVSSVSCKLLRTKLFSVAPASSTSIFVRSVLAEQRNASSLLPARGTFQGSSQRLSLFIICEEFLGDVKLVNMRWERNKDWASKRETCIV